MLRAIIAARVLAVCLVGLALVACSARPFPTTPAKTVKRALDRDYANAPGPRPWALSLCYSQAVNSPEEVLAEARFYCKDGEVALLGQDILWTPCPLLQPVRASFLCRPKPSPPEAKPAPQAN
jgi:hypothetical protein